MTFLQMMMFKFGLFCEVVGEEGGGTFEGMFFVDSNFFDARECPFYTQK
jgi:hypothetical protein